MKLIKNMACLALCLALGSCTKATIITAKSGEYYLLLNDTKSTRAHIHLDFDKAQYDFYDPYLIGGGSHNHGNMIVDGNAIDATDWYPMKSGEYRHYKFEIISEDDIVFKESTVPFMIYGVEIKEGYVFHYENEE